MTMLLSFYDTYWDDDFIGDGLETSVYLPNEYADIFSVSSPGCVKNENPPYRNPEVNTSGMSRSEFRRYYIRENSDTYLQFYLICLGANLIPSINSSMDDLGLNYLQIMRILEAYLSEIFVGSEYRIMSSCLNVRQSVISAVKRGIPCILEVPGHFVVAYDYDEENDILYGHLGWHGEDFQHVNLDDAYGSYESFIYLDINSPHNHTNNYRYYDENGNEHSVCPCSKMVPSNILGDNIYVDGLPVFSWNCLIDEKWFGDPNDISITLSILDNNRHSVIDIGDLNECSYRLSSNEWRTVINRSPDLFYVYLALVSDVDPYLDDMSCVRMFIGPDSFKNKSQIKPVDFDFDGNNQTANIVKDNLTISCSFSNVFVQNGYVAFVANDQQQSYLEMSFSRPVYSLLHSFQYFSNSEHYANALIKARDVFGNWQIVSNLLNGYPLIGTYGYDRLQRYNIFDFFGYTALRIEVTSSVQSSTLLMDDLVLVTSTSVNDFVFDITDYRKTTW